ncbi:uncharacterized protein A1O5_01367 [Cladophialophora psammophila CBS 110553]|uniref:Short-chain dehydrogenase n=1 Tax=Cladophialophora psammophila CBS 110553 TaxID=1182543 RepID=W9XWN5_9EURO|nr:uncharacterized protein A1O5_01367 [Cladophialophora psammophila CBS 110553]EXJ74674.1 hypothetical protein A1O5_01367 [Cladophialophora psammophila CBS 110553]
MAVVVPKPVVLLLGAGSNIGDAVVRYFSANKFRVAAVSRSMEEGVDSGGVLNITADLGNPDAVPTIFTKVEAHWDVPTVVIYNAASRTLQLPNDPMSTFSITQYQHDHNVNVASALVACLFAVKGFARLPPSTLKTFFYTGNKLHVMSSPQALTFGMDKAAMAHCIWDCVVAYHEAGYKFYCTDERLSDGRPARELMSGEARAKAMLALVEEPAQQPWCYTLVKGKGYVNFEDLDKGAARNVDAE